MVRVVVIGLTQGIGKTPAWHCSEVFDGVLAAVCRREARRFPIM